MLCWCEAKAAASMCLSGLEPTCLWRGPISIDLKDICKFPGWKGASAKSFTTSGFIHHLKSKHPITILNMSWDIRMRIKKRKCWALWARECSRGNDPLPYRSMKATFLTWQRWPSKTIWCCKPLGKPWGLHPMMLQRLELSQCSHARWHLALGGWLLLPL